MEKCAQGVQMNWSLLLMNQLMDDALTVQEGQRPFAYSWMIILIALVAWMQMDDYQGMDVDTINICKGAR